MVAAAAGSFDRSFSYGTDAVLAAPYRAKLWYILTGEMMQTREVPGKETLWRIVSGAAVLRTIIFG
jgi:hypothetical protein